MTPTNPPTTRSGAESLDEAQLVAACRAGDAIAFAALYRAHIDVIYGFVLGRVGPDRAEDVVSETFAAAWQAIESYDPNVGTVRGWLYGIATNVLRRHRRAEMRWSESLALLDAEQRTELDPAMPSRALLRGLLELSPTTRDLLMLVALGDMTTAAAAQTLGIRRGAARVRLHRARKHLHATLDEGSRNA